MITEMTRTGFVMATLLFGVVVVVPAHPVEAQGERGAEERALELTREAQARYDEGDLEAAIALLLEARELYPEPLISYNLARAYEAAGNERAALQAYERYVEEQPDAPDRPAMEAHIERLRAQMAERDRLAREREQERRRREAAERRARERGVNPWPWVLVATGGAALGAGLVLGVVAQSQRDAAAEDPVHVTTVSSFEEARAFATAANVLFVVGGVLALGGAIWLVVNLVSGDDEERIEVGLSPGGVAVRGRW